jgi:hypothetical protein
MGVVGACGLCLGVGACVGVSVGARACRQYGAGVGVGVGVGVNVGVGVGVGMIVGACVWGSGAGDTTHRHLHPRLEAPEGGLNLQRGHGGLVPPAVPVL